MTLSVLPAFSSGILSPELSSSIELEKHRYGAKDISNMIVNTLGGVKNRPGTQYSADAYSTSILSRLIPFQFNVVQAYVLEFSNLKMRIFKDGALVGGPTEVVSPYATADLPDLKYTQSADTLYIFHPNYKIRKITRTSDTVWTITEIATVDGPYKARVAGDEDVRINITFFAGSTWDFTADTAIFGDVEVGEPIRLGFPVPGDATALFWTWYDVIGVTDSTHIKATLQEETWPVYQQVVNPRFANGNTSWQETTAPAGSGSLSYDFANQRAVMTDGGVSYARMEQPVLTFANVNHRLLVNIALLSGTTPTATINVGTTSGASDIYTSGALTTPGLKVATILNTAETVYISINTNGTGVGGTVEIDRVEMIPVGDEPTAGTEHNTIEWRLAAWNSTHGYPEHGVINEQRLICARNAAQPQTIWPSKTGDFESWGFSTPTVAIDSFSFNPPTAEINGILWLHLQNGLKVGTADGIWKVFAASGGVITPTDVNIEIDNAEGSLDLAPIKAGNAIMMTPRGTSAVTEINSSFEAGGFVPRDVSILAQHLFKDRRIIRWAFAKNPDSVIWCILDDGTLLGFTYNKTYDIWAWHRHFTPLGVGFADIVVIPNSSDDNIDDVYFMINRAASGEAPNYYIETLNKRITSQTAAFGLSASGTPYDYKFLDSALTLDDPKTITGATKADPVVLTVAGHGYSNGDLVRIQNVVGMTELNNNVYKVANKTATTYELNDEDDNTIDGTAFTTYLTGGESRKMVTAVTGLDHLEGLAVTALADGAPRSGGAGMTVTSGAITLPQAASFIHVGIAYASYLETLDLEIMAEGGTTQGKRKALTKATIYFNDTRNATVIAANRTDVVRTIPFENESDGEQPPDLFSGTKEVGIPDYYRNQSRLIIQQLDPLPMEVKRIIPDVDYSR